MFELKPHLPAIVKGKSNKNHSTEDHKTDFRFKIKNKNREVFGLGNEKVPRAII